VNKLLGYMGFFTWLANGKHKSNTIEKEDIEKMVKRNLKWVYSDSKGIGKDLHVDIIHKCF